MHVHDYVIIQAVTDLQDGTLKKGTGHQYKNFFFFTLHLQNSYTQNIHLLILFVMYYLNPGMIS